MTTTLGQRIRHERKRKGLSTHALAGSVGVSGSTVSEWENDVTEPRAAKLMKLAQFFGCSVDDLLTARPLPDPAPVRTLAPPVPEPEPVEAAPALTPLPPADGAEADYLRGRYLSRPRFDEAGERRLLAATMADVLVRRLALAALMERWRRRVPDPPTDPEGMRRLALWLVAERGKTCERPTRPGPCVSSPSGGARSSPASASGR